MKKFLVLYHMSPAALAKHNALSPDDMKKMTDAWMVWKDRCGAGLVDMGGGVKRQHIITNHGIKEESDDLGGYSFIKAKDINEAKALLDSNPLLSEDDGSTISLYEVMEM